MNMNRRLAEISKYASMKGFKIDITSNKSLATSLNQAYVNDDPTFNQVCFLFHLFIIF